MVTTSSCRDRGEHRPADEFTADQRRADGLAFYCKTHARRRWPAAKDATRGAPTSRHPRGVVVPDEHKWCPDCSTVKPLDQFVRNAGQPSGFAPYCKPCHNVRGTASKDKIGGSRTYHLERRYGITAADADAMLEAQGGLCAVCRTAPAAHVDHDHATGVVRELLCSNCNGGLGQFRDDPAVLRAAADYVERHRARQAAGDGSGGSRPGTPGRPGSPPVGSAGRPSASRRTGRNSTNSRRSAAGEADA